MLSKEKSGLTLAERNDFVRVEENINNNLIKIDDDVDATWGGLYGGGRIEDANVVKVVGKRYIGADGKAYICKVASNVNNTTNYTPCNVVDNLDKLQNLVKTTKTQVAEIVLGDIGATLVLNKYENDRWLEYEFVINLNQLSIGLNQLVKTDTKTSSYIGVNLDAFFFTMKVAGTGTTASISSNANVLMFKFLDSSKPSGISASVYGYSKKFFK